MDVYILYYWSAFAAHIRPDLSKIFTHNSQFESFSFHRYKQKSILIITTIIQFYVTRIEKSSKNSHTNQTAIVVYCRKKNNWIYQFLFLILNDEWFFFLVDCPPFGFNILNFFCSRDDFISVNSVIKTIVVLVFPDF